MKKIVTTIISVLFLFYLSAASTIGKMPSESVLNFTNYASNYIILSNSLIVTNNITEEEECVESSSFTINKNMPLDALPEKAYLIYMEAGNPENLNQKPNNKFSLSFKPAYSDKKISEDLTGVERSDFSTEEHLFEYESISWSENYESGKINPVFYTHRIDVSDFFKKILESGRPIVDFDGNSFLGEYTFSRDLSFCSNHIFYKNQGILSSGWAIIFIYRSEQESVKKIKMFNGLAALKHTLSEIYIEDFEIPLEGKIQISSIVGGGEDGIQKTFDPYQPDSNQLHPELLSIHGTEASEPYILSDKCNKIMKQAENQKGEMSDYIYAETFNSLSSFPDPLSGEISCLPTKYFDTDTFILDIKKDNNLYEHITLGQESIKLSLSVNEDYVITNILSAAIDTRPHPFDIPKQREFDVSFNHTGCLNRIECKDIVSNENKICNNEETLLGITIINNGFNPLKNIGLKLNMSSKFLKYIPNSASVYKYDRWSYLSDINVDKPVEVIPELKPKESAFVQFKIIYSGEIIDQKIVDEISAEITADGIEPYKTNSGMPLVLKVDFNCPANIVSDDDSFDDKDSLSDEDANLYDADAKSYDADITDENESTIDMDSTNNSSKKESGCGCSIIF